jgi:hypothetical protein
VWLFFTLITILFITDVVAVASNEFYDPSVCRKNLFLVYALFEIACQEKDEKMVEGIAMREMGTLERERNHQPLGSVFQNGIDRGR